MADPRKRPSDLMSPPASRWPGGFAEESTQGTSMSSTLNSSLTCSHTAVAVTQSQDGDRECLSQSSSGTLNHQSQDAYQSQDYYGSRGCNYPTICPNLNDADGEDDPLGDTQDADGSDDEGSLAKDFLEDDDKDIDFQDEYERKISDPPDPNPVFLLKDGKYEKHLNFPTVPEDYRHQNDFDGIDNPGGWSNYIYTPKYTKPPKPGLPGKYLYHGLPSGATPVPGEGTVRSYMGWDFHYDLWDGASRDHPPASTPQNQTPLCTPVHHVIPVPGEDGLSRKFVSPDAKNIFPQDRKGSLDADKLRYYSLSKTRMEQGDALFFYQLLLPLHLPERMQEKGFDDTRKNFYNEVLLHTNQYHVAKYSGGYLPLPKTIAFEELLKFDGILYLHSALGSKHDIRKRWMKQSNFYQSSIATSKVSWSRWCEIKGNMKLCDNAIEEARPDFNPAYKFDLIYECLIHNVNEFTKHACLDLVIDESTWPYYGFGPLVDYLVDKMVTRGGHTVLLMDADRLRPRGFLHRRKKYAAKDGFPTKGMSEVYDLIRKYVIPKMGEEQGKKWAYGPHLTVDNYFNGDQILDWMGENGMGMIGTVARNRLSHGFNSTGTPVAIPGNFYHKETTAGNPRARLARFANPITLVKTVQPKDRYPNGTLIKRKFLKKRVPFWRTGQVAAYHSSRQVYHVIYDDGHKEDMIESEIVRSLLDPEDTPMKTTKPYRRVHCSFQSTGPCNIGSVNSVPSSYAYVSPRQRGRGNQKLHWGIEMNHSRELYLKSYGRIDQTDAYISRLDIKYTCWKYYHAALNHAKSLVIATAYDMYKECCEGTLDLDWKVSTRSMLSFNDFQQRLGKQLIQYRSADYHLPGDSWLRGAKATHIDRRGRGSLLTWTPPSSSKRSRMRYRTTPYETPNKVQLDYISLPLVTKAKINGRFCMSLIECVLFVVLPAIQSACCVWIVMATMEFHYVQGIRAQ